jgi:glucuronide carrier protein
MFLLLYYTDVAKIPAAAVGTMFLVVRIWSAVTDLIAGRIVDRTNTKWGKFRPFLLFGSIPLLLLSFLTFHVPDWSLGGKMVYAYVTYALLDFAYSMVNIPYGSLATVMTQDPRERTRLGASRGVGASVIVLVLVLVITPQIKHAADLQFTFTVTSAVFIVVGVALYFFTFFTAREQVARAVSHVSLRQTLATLRRNGPLLQLCVSTLIYLTGMMAWLGSGIYYARDVLGDANLYIVLMTISTAMAFVVAPLAPKLVARFGKKHCCLASVVLSVVGGGGIFLAPASAPGVAIAFWAVAGFGVGMVNTLMWVFEADTVEYGEWRTGMRTEGVSYAVFSFTRKLGQALGGAAGAYALALGGYLGGAPRQPESALIAIRATVGLLPAATAVLAGIVIAFYPLTDRRFGEIVAQLHQRRGATDESSEPTVMTG